MDPPPAITAQVGVNATTLPPASLATATYCCVAPIPSDIGFGVTVMVAIGPMVTVTVAVPDLPPLDATTVLVNVPGVVPAVNWPVALMEPPPAATDHTGVIGVMVPSKSLPTAVNCCVPLMGRVVGFGDTVIVATLPASRGECTSHAESDRPATATNASSRATRLRGARTCTMRLFRKLFIELLRPDTCERDGNADAPQLAAIFNGCVSVMVIGVPGVTITSRSVCVALVAPSVARPLRV